VKWNILPHLKGHWSTEKVFQINISGDMPSIWVATILKKFLVVCLKDTILKCSFYRCKNLVTCGPGPQINMIPGAGPNFLICRYAHAQFEWCAVCHLVITLLLAAATGSVRPPTFRLRSAPPQERPVKTFIPVFFRLICGLPQAFYRDMRSATIVIMGGKWLKFHLYSACEFSKIVAFKGMIRKFLYIVAVHIEGLGILPYAYYTQFFRVSVPLREWW
jgi:hypothetical protein